MSDDRMERLAEESRAFEAIRDELVAKHGTGYAVVQGGQLVDVFPSGRMPSALR